MKRRSPWLAFAACALLNGPLQAERTPKKPEQPRLALSMAANAVEMELEKLGLAGNHAVSSIALNSTRGLACYLAEIDPPILVPSTNPAFVRLAFQVEMDGSVTVREMAVSPRALRST